MKRIAYGLLWFVALFIVLYLLVQIGVALAALHGIRDFRDQQAVVQAASGFIGAHLGLIRLLDALALLVALLAAALGTWKGILPGTGKKKLG